jgi:hypothetical protein
MASPDRWDIVARPSAPSAPWLSASLRDQSASGGLPPTAIPRVSIIKEAQQFNGDAAVDDGSRGLRQAVFSGMPVVKVGRGNNEGFTSLAAAFSVGQ